MILVDTSIWVDHLRRGDPELVDLLERSAVVTHPFVVGEIACGSLRDRQSILELLQDLPAAMVASPDEVLKFIENRSVHGQGVGYIDVHLLASVALSPGTRLWTRDTKLRRVAEWLDCAHPDSVH